MIAEWKTHTPLVLNLLGSGTFEAQSYSFNITHHKEAAAIMTCIKWPPALLQTCTRSTGFLQIQADRRQENTADNNISNI